MNKYNDAWIVKRTIQVSGLITHQQSQTISQSLSDIVGIIDTKINFNLSELSISYDASMINFQTIQNTLLKQDISFLDNWWSRIKYTWYQYTDDNANASANAPPAACCNKPQRED